MAMKQAILTLNTGSSSIKFALYEVDGKTRNLNRMGKGSLSSMPAAPRLSATWGEGHTTQEIWNPMDFHEAFKNLLQWLTKTFPYHTWCSVGHRVVHGGTFYETSVQISDEVLKNLESLCPLAPLHQPHNLKGIRILQTLYPELPQIACFDTAFHITQPYLATLFGLPHSMWKEGVRRYGFHGLSYAYIASVLETYAGKRGKGRVIVAHLGHGASLCALKNLKSIATTMGFTALDGIPMGTRCGAIDPGVILYLLTEKGYSLESLTDLLYNKSGLLGLSGESDDMRNLLESPSEQAKQAIDYFCYRIQREIGSLAATLGGLDMLIFTGGIGENAPAIREKVCEGLEWLRILFHKEANRIIPENLCISAPTSEVDVFVIPTDEEHIIAQDTLSLLLQNNL